MMSCWFEVVVECDANTIRRRALAWEKALDEVERYGWA